MQAINSVDEGVQVAQTPGPRVDHATIDTLENRLPNQESLTGNLESEDNILHDPGTGSTTYIGRSHYEGNGPIDEATARSYTQSRQKDLSDIERKTLELWNVYSLPPRPVHESLVEAFTEYCSPWMPVLEPDDMQTPASRDNSLLLAQAVFLAASRVTSSSSVQAFSTPADFYQRAKALYWVGHEKNPLTVIKATTMLHWYTPDGPAFVSYDTSEYWLRIGVGLAHQIGLHREPPHGPKRAIRRRVWWTLVVSLRHLRVVRMQCSHNYIIGSRCSNFRFAWQASSCTIRGFRCGSTNAGRLSRIPFSRRIVYFLC